MMEPLNKIRTSNPMPRYKNRPLRWPDVLGRFEAGSYTWHYRNARGLIERISDEGTTFFDKNPKLLHKWQEYCSNLLTFLNDLLQRRSKQKLETAMREFVHEFEHSTEHMEVLLHKVSTNLNAKEKVGSIRILFDVAYRVSTYALLSAWIPEKHDNLSIEIVVDRSTGKVTEKVKQKKMRVPKKYRKNAKLL